MEGFEANSTIDVSRIRQAFVCFESLCLYTDSALVAMGVFGDASHSADATVATVKLSFVLVIEKNAHRAPVGTEGRSTGDTRRTGWLNRVT
jgi:hypothetical protein